MKAAGDRARRSTLRPEWWIILLPALILTLFDAVKPLHMDDPFGLRVAQQIVHHPADPYGFEIFWVQWPQPASEELTPPVLPYWWSIGLRLFGDSPVLWKLWLFPFAALLSLAWWSLVRRLAAGLEGPLAWMLPLSTVVLPGFNLMQDVPALALGTGALALFARAVERGGWGTAALAGTVAGLATQTKYTAVGFCVAIFLWGALRRRWGPTIVALVAAAVIFVGWEGWMTLRYGQGMLSGQLEEDLYWVARPAMALHLVRLVGAVLAVPVLLGLPAFGVRGTTALGVGALVLAGYGMLWFVPLAGALYLVLGLAAGALLLALAATAVRNGLMSGTPTTRDGLFLGLWLAAEIGIFFAAAPFPAVRRVTGIALVATLLVGHAVAPRVGTAASRSWIRGLVGVSVILGMLHATVDVLEARAQRRAVDWARERIVAEPRRGTVWFVGHWGFQYYAEAAGWEAVVPDVSRLQAGDWLVVPEPLHRQEVRLSEDDLSLEATLRDESGPPWTTGRGYYADSRPLTHLDGPRLETRLYRVRRDVVPETSWSAAQLAAFAGSALDRTAAAALPALLRFLSSRQAGERVEAVRGLAALAAGSFPAAAERAAAALDQALRDPDPAVRAAAAAARGGGAVDQK